MDNNKTRRRNFHSEMKNRIENRLYGSTRSRRPRTHGLSPLNPIREKQNARKRENENARKKATPHSFKRKRNGSNNLMRKMMRTSEYDPYNV
jgi:hypothetical protein